jgi:hypothetical protein
MGESLCPNHAKSCHVIYRSAASRGGRGEYCQYSQEKLADNKRRLDSKIIALNPNDSVALL